MFLSITKKIGDLTFGITLVAIRTQDFSAQKAIIFEINADVRTSSLA